MSILKGNMIAKRSTNPDPGVAAPGAADGGGAYLKNRYNYVRRTITWEGKRYEVTGKTEQEAADKLAELKVSLKNGLRTVGADSPVDRWFQEWMDLYKASAGLTEKSLAMYPQKYYSYISPRIGKMKLSAVREAHLQRILNDEAGRSKSHVSKLRLIMKEMFSKARKTRIIPFDPAEDLILPETTKGKRRSITEEERAHILAVAEDHRAGLWVLTLLYAGLRPGETAVLQWKDIDFDANEIHVHKALESGRNAVKSPKTDAGLRDIPLRPELRERLFSRRGGPFEPVFTLTNGNRLTEDGMQRMWRSFKRALDLHMGAKMYRNRIIKSVVADDLTAYCLRHTFCTDLQRAGIPINVAKELMGHSDISVTANIYTHRDQKVLHANISKMYPVENSVENSEKEAKTS